MIVHHERVDAAMEIKAEPFPFIMLTDAPKVVHTGAPKGLSFESASGTGCNLIGLSHLQKSGDQWSENAVTSVRFVKGYLSNHILPRNTHVVFQTEVFTDIFASTERESISDFTYGRLNRFKCVTLLACTLKIPSLSTTFNRRCTVAQSYQKTPHNIE
jgi:hypothetical protein